MPNPDLESAALALVVEGKGILAADESTPTLTRRFDTLGIQSSEEARRSYREMLFDTPGIGEFISGVIMYDETIRRASSAGAPFAELLAARGMLPGIKVDTGAKLLAGSPRETVTEGPDGLRDGLAWHGRAANRAAGQRALFQRASCNGAASVGAYSDAMGRPCPAPMIRPTVASGGTIETFGRG
jgi:fructose-bisphosphate aldolase, class I